MLPAKGAISRRLPPIVSVKTATMTLGARRAKAAIPLASGAQGLGRTSARPVTLGPLELGRATTVWLCKATTRLHLRWSFVPNATTDASPALPPRPPATAATVLSSAL